MSHNPVLLNQVIHFLAPRDGACYLDATFGAGGCSTALLESAKCQIYAMDRDQTVKPFFESLQQRFRNQITLHFKKFSEIPSIFPCGSYFDGIIFDLGVSSMQLDTPSRGFAFSYDGPLDMRMSSQDTLTAKMIVNQYSEKQLADLLYHFGDEPRAKKIAKAIVQARAKQYIENTSHLARIIRSLFPPKRYRIDPATKSFQAIRIAVNDEINQLKAGITATLPMLKSHGVLVVISFHSLEDTIVKQSFKSLAASGSYTLLTKHATTPELAEITANPRSRSAKLRAIRKN